MTTLAIVGAVVSLAIGLLSLLAIAVQLGRVLQRQDANDAADIERDKIVAALRESKHAHGNLLTSLASRVEVLGASDQRSDTTMREVLALITDVSNRLIRMESRIEGSSPHLRARTPTPR